MKEEEVDYEGIDETEEEYVDEIDDSELKTVDREPAADGPIDYYEDLGPASGLTTWMQAIVFTAIFSSFIVVLAGILWLMQD